MKRPLRVVSNRLPIVISQADGDQWSINSASGGLVTALKPVLHQYGGVWIGWPGEVGEAPLDPLLSQLGEEFHCVFRALQLPHHVVEGFYYGFSNETLWPLFHDLLGHAEFDEAKWRIYRDTNRVFAEFAIKDIQPEEIIWVHDYQLLLVAEAIRSHGVQNWIAHFLHIPFPAPDIFARLPWRAEILKGMLSYDLLGFQQQRDLRNFSQCVRHFVPKAVLESSGRLTEIEVGSHIVRAGFFPISIDFEDFDARARSKEGSDAAWIFHENYPNRQIVIGVDRLDYTKGIPAKFLAYERALEKYPDLQGQISFVQIVVPSRQDIPEYARWKSYLEGIVGRINGRFGRPGWVPLHYLYRSVSPTDLVGCYRASEIALVTPLKDGMNLVCKEFCAASIEENGVLILSEFAGAAQQLKNGALIVNPHDLEGTADAIHRAYTMNDGERRVRMKRLRREISRHDVYFWVESILREMNLWESRHS